MDGKCHLAIYLLLHLVVESTVSIRCDREPEGHTSEKSEVNNRFRIKISGNPNKYVPGEVYSVSLQAERNQHSSNKFTGFMLVVEPYNDYMSPDSYFKGSIHDDFHHRNVGTFSMYGDTLTKFSDSCPNAVVQTSSLAKSEIQVFWNAPPARSGCVVFRATVVESRDHWFMDDGPLSHVLCEEVQDNDDDQPKIENPCCACDEAKYEVTFEGLWSRHTHPKDFPTNGWLTRFSDVIGASHSVGYRFWDYGKFATEGLRQVAERGSTRMLESELKADSQHIRTIIKARGISYPNVTGKTFAVFRVDSKHHLMSIVSMIDPSPDWIVGVSGLELCQRNCSWIEHKVLNLYPWDVGTDAGITYISHDIPSSPREPIRRITSSFPNDPKSPFFDPSGEEMKPLARLYLTRQRLYEKSCSEDGEGADTEEDLKSAELAECQVSEWSAWGDCSVTCGKGVRHRQRSYKDKLKAAIKSCNVKLTSKHGCMGIQETCGPQDLEETELAPLDPVCATTEWTPWTGCSVTCGRGVRMRIRKFLSPYGNKRCLHKPNAPRLEQTDDCEVLDRICGDSLEDSQEGDSCPMTEWSRWSPCSVTCGKGKHMRTRLRIVYNEDTKLMYEHMDEGYGPFSMRDCEDVKIKEEIDCVGLPSCEISPSEARGICQLPKEEGPCSGNHTRWFFDTQSGTCQEFMYSGCRGNRNKFFSLEDCERTCREYKEDENEHEDGGTTINPNFSDLTVLNSISDTSRPSTDPGETDDNVVDCELTRWSAWSECSATCGRGYRTRSRTIKVHGRNGGKPCPKKLIRRKKCKRACNSDGVPDVNPTWGEAKPPIKVPSVDCILSEWTTWSPCSVTCGMNAVKQRTRSIIRLNSGGGFPCDIRLEIASCDVLPCLE